MRPRIIGMTLVELLVVLGVIGVIVGMSVPGLVGYARAARLKTAVRQTVGLASLARSLAISSHEEHAVVFDPQQQRLRLLNVATGEPLEQVVRLPDSVRVALRVGGETAEESHIVFRPSGALSSRSLTLTFSDEERSQTITITGATGAITVE